MMGSATSLISDNSVMPLCLSKLPADMIGLQVLPFLPLADLVKLDNAIVGKHNRPLLEAILSSAVVTIFDDYSNVKRQGCWDWCVRRGITLENLLLYVVVLEGRDAELLPQILCRVRTGGLVTVKKVWTDPVGSESIDIFNRPEVLDKVSYLELVCILPTGPLLGACRGLNHLGKIRIVDSQIAESWIAALIDANKSLRYVELDRVPALGTQTAEALRAVGASLRELSLQDTALSTEVFDAIKECCSNVASLTFGQCKDATDGDAFGAGVATAVQGCRKVRTLTLECTQLLPDEAMLSIAAHCVQMRKLYFARGQGVLTDAVLLSLAANCPHLDHLHSLQWAVASLATVDTARPLLQRLTVLYIDAGAAETAPVLSHALEYLDRVTDLHLSSLTQAHAPALGCTVKAPFLQKLTVRCGCTEKLNLDVLFLALTDSCARLKSLKLNGQIELQEATIYSLFGNCPTLQTLYLDKVIHPCTDTTILAVAQYCPEIVEVNISDHSWVTEGPLLELVTKCLKLRFLKPPILFSWKYMQNVVERAREVRGKHFSLARWND